MLEEGLSWSHLHVNGLLTLTMSLHEITKSECGYSRENHREHSLGATQHYRLERREGISKEIKRRDH